MADLSDSNQNTGYEPPSKQESLFKILVVGEFGVGKTAIIKRYTEGTFSPNYKLTIGVDFALKNINVDENKKVTLQLWDIAGHERFGHMTRVYYKYAIAAVIVFDVTRPGTYDAVKKWMSDIDSKVILPNGDTVPTMLLANKIDIEDAKYDNEELDLFCKEHNMIGWFPTSAKNDTNIDQAMLFLTEKIISLPEMIQKPSEYITLNDDSFEQSVEQPGDDEGKKKSDCCT